MSKVCIVFFLVVFPALARSAEFSCPNVACLIAAINSANTQAGADKINLEPGTYSVTSVDNGTGSVAYGLPTTTTDITISVDAATTVFKRGPGAPDFRIFAIANTGKLTLNRLAVTGGEPASFGTGTNNNRTLTINGSTIESKSGLAEGDHLLSFDGNQWPLPLAGSGVLRVSPINSRYFTDGNGKAVYLTGSHTWTGLIDRGPTDPARPFDFARYLDLLQSANHNFMRLWSRHVTRYQSYGIDVLHGTPLPWARSGPGIALDGKPRFDLNRFDDRYFTRLRDRVMAARERGIYVAIMLFGGYVEVSEWAGNPFNAANNVNGIDGDLNGNGNGDTHRVPLPPDIDLIQKAYVRKVIDTVNDLDNVLFEISNEGELSSVAWQFQLVNFIKDYEAGRIDGVLRKQHPVGITALWTTDNAALLQSAADWISPGAVTADSARESYIGDPPAADGRKVSILDSDHLFFDLIIDNPTAARAWVWKSFLRGHNPILMENIFDDSTGKAVSVTTHDPGFTAARKAMGHTLRYANTMNLIAMMPRGDLTSTCYALADPGSEYIVYQPRAEPFTVDLIAGSYSFEWFHPSIGSVYFTGSLVAEGARTFVPPFDGDAVLYLRHLGS